MISITRMTRYLANPVRPPRPSFAHDSVPTVLDGIRYRSRLEVRWAVFFRQLGLSFLYEPLTAHFRTGGAYKPDFFLLGDLQCWYEVKPSRVVADRERAGGRMRELVRQTGNAGYVACGLPGSECDVEQQGPGGVASSVMWVDPGRLLPVDLATSAWRRQVERAAWVAQHYRFDEDDQAPHVAVDREGVEL